MPPPPDQFSSPPSSSPPSSPSYKFLFFPPPQPQNSRSMPLFAPGPGRKHGLANLHGTYKDMSPSQNHQHQRIEKKFEQVGGYKNVDDEKEGEGEGNVQEKCGGQEDVSEKSKEGDREDGKCRREEEEDEQPTTGALTVTTKSESYTSLQDALYQPEPSTPIRSPPRNSEILVANCGFIPMTPPSLRILRLTLRRHSGSQAASPSKSPRKRDGSGPTTPTSASSEIAKSASSSSSIKAIVPEILRLSADTFVPPLSSGPAIPLSIDMSRLATFSPESPEKVDPGQTGGESPSKLRKKFPPDQISALKAGWKVNGEGEFPVAYFLYGRLANVKELQRILRSLEEPQVRNARLVGFKQESWGLGTTVVPCGPKDLAFGARKPEAVKGVVYTITCRDEEEKLKTHVDMSYRVTPVDIEISAQGFRRSRMVQGKTFIANSDELTKQHAPTNLVAEVREISMREQRRLDALRAQQEAIRLESDKKRLTTTESHSEIGPSKIETPRVVGVKNGEKRSGSVNMESGLEKPLPDRYTVARSEDENFSILGEMANSVELVEMSRITRKTYIDKDLPALPPARPDSETLGLPRSCMDKPLPEMPEGQDVEWLDRDELDFDKAVADEVVSRKVKKQRSRALEKLESSYDREVNDHRHDALKRLEGQA